MYARDALNQLNAYARSHGSGRDLNQGEIDEASKAIGWQPGMDVDASAMPAFQREIDNRLRAAGAYQEQTPGPGFSGPPAPNPHHPGDPHHPDHPIEMAGPQIRDPAAPVQEQPGRMIPEPAMPPQLEMPGRMSHDPAYQPPPPPSAPAPNPASPESAPAMTEQRQAAPPPPQPATQASPQPASMRALRAAPTSGGVGWNTPATPGPAQLGQQQQGAKRASMSAIASRGRLY